MPQWTVTGADKKTGKDTSLLVEAPTEKHARELASTRGILVAEVLPSDPTTAPPPLNVPTATLAPVAYQSAKTSAKDPYRALLTSAFLFKILALSLLATAILQMLDGGYQLIFKASSLSPTALSGPAIDFSIQSTLSAAGGALCYFLSGLAKVAHALARKHVP